MSQVWKDQRMDPDLAIANRDTGVGVEVHVEGTGVGNGDKGGMIGGIDGATAEVVGGNGTEEIITKREIVVFMTGTETEIGIDGLDRITDKGQGGEVENLRSNLWRLLEDTLDR